MRGSQSPTISAHGLDERDVVVDHSVPLDHRDVVVRAIRATPSKVRWISGRIPSLGAGVDQHFPMPQSKGQNMNPNRLILAGTATALVVPSLLVAAAPGSAATLDLGTRVGDVVSISAPTTAKRMKLFKITCQAPTNLAGGRVHLYQNGNIFKLSKVTVSKTGACNFKVKSGVKGLNTFDVAVVKSGVTYQSNSATVQIGPKTTLAKQPKGAITLKGAKTTTLWAKYKIKCQAPSSLAGGKVTLYQNGAVLPQKSQFRVGDNGSCNFWIKSGLLGLNTFDMSVAKGGRTYQSNALNVTVNS